MIFAGGGVDDAHVEVVMRRRTGVRSRVRPRPMWWSWPLMRCVTLPALTRSWRMHPLAIPTAHRVPYLGSKMCWCDLWREGRRLRAEHAQPLPPKGPAIYERVVVIRSLRVTSVEVPEQPVGERTATGLPEWRRQGPELRHRKERVLEMCRPTIVSCEVVGMSCSDCHELVTAEVIVGHHHEVDVTRGVEVAHGKGPNQVHPYEVPRACALQCKGVLGQ